jgi:transposase
MNETGMSTVDAAANFNISSSRLIRKWRNQFETGGFYALQSKKKGRPSMNKKRRKERSQHPLKVLWKHLKHASNNWKWRMLT